MQLKFLKAFFIVWIGFNAFHMLAKGNIIIHNNVFTKTKTLPFFEKSYQKLIYNSDLFLKKNDLRNKKPTVLLGINKPYTQNKLQDSDGDGIIDDVDLDDDNDGILDADEGACMNGLTANTAFRSLSQARNVTTAAVYFFDLNGEAFSTYVDNNGYVLVAIDFGNGSGNLPQVAALDSINRGVLTPTKLAELDDIIQVRISHSGGQLDATTNNATIINRVKTNAILHRGLIDNGINNGWIGTNASFLTGSPNCNTPGASNLNSNVVHTCGDVNGTVWIPASGQQYYSYNSGQIGNTESLRLWVQGNTYTERDTDGDGLADYLDLDVDGDGCADAIEGDGSFTSADLITSGMLGGNTGGSYTGSSSSSVSDNLGNTVDTNPASTSYGVPTIAGSGQAIGGGQNGLINLCLDSDSDSIADFYDLDDDNDGILDTDEGCSIVPIAIYSQDFQSYTLGRVNVGGDILPTSGSSHNWYSNAGGNTAAAASAWFTTGADKGLAVGDHALWMSDNPGLGFDYLFVSAPISVISGENYQIRFDAARSSNNPPPVFNAYLSYDNGVTWELLPGLSQPPANNFFRTITLNFTATNNSVILRIANAVSGSFGNDGGINDIQILKDTIICIDTDMDGIDDYLDLDSDGDGCADAVEGGGSFTSADLVASGMPGGNTGGSYTGYSSSVSDNLGNTVDTNPASASYGVPTIAGSGQTVGDSQNGIINLCLDSDSDNINDVDDLDDDNDGILDVDEQFCRSTSGLQAISQIAGTNPWPGLSNSTFTSTSTASGVNLSIRNTSSIVTALGNNYSYNTDVLISPVSNTNTTAIAYTFSPPVPANEIGIYVLDVHLSNSGLRVSTSVSGSGTATTEDFYMENTGYSPTHGYDPSTGEWLFTSGTPTSNNRYTGTLVGTGTNTVETITLNFQNLRNADRVAHLLLPLATCDYYFDLDGDGIPNTLDLDSDGDGCPDAIEGGASFTSADLVVSGMAGGNTGGNYTGSSITPIVDNLGNVIETNSASAAYGVPITAGNGQTIGSSQNGGIKDVNCPCITIDSDMDGICDVEDLDDDNDGILDTDENACITATIGWTNNSNQNQDHIIGDPTPIVQGATDYILGAGLSKSDGPNTVILSNINHATLIDALANNDFITYTFTTRPTLPLHIGFAGITHSSHNTPNNYYFAYQISTDGVNFQTLVQNLVASPASLYNGMNWTNSADYPLTSATTYTIRIIFYGASGNVYWDDALISFCESQDTDSDNIPDYLDLDSDGDGCPDAIEGGANFMTADLVNSNMAGGNTGGSYTGSSATSVSDNLGNTVDMNPASAAYGVPIIAGNGQTVGDSQNGAVQSADCPTCDYVLVSVNATNDSDCSNSNGSIEVVLNQEIGSCIQISLDGGNSWEANNNTTFNGLSSGSYQLQIRQCDRSCPVVYGEVMLVGPVAVITANDTFSSCPGFTVQNNVAFNDENLAATKFSIHTNPVNGNVTILDNGVFTYIPSSNTCGIDQFTYQICDTSTDCCALANVYLTFEDTTLPKLYNIPANDTVHCDEQIPLAPLISAYDNCPAIQVDVAEESTQGEDGCSLYDYQLTRTWTATDACGNSTSEHQIIEIQDITAPDIFRIYTLPNGSKLVAGVMENVSQNWKTISLPIDFSSKPLIFSQVVTTEETTPVITRTRNVSNSQFDLRLQEEDGQDGKHIRESVAWIAIEAGNQSTDFLLETRLITLSNVSTTQNFNFTYNPFPSLFATMQTTIDSDPAGLRFNINNLTSINLHLEEEISVDADISHANEQVAFMAITNDTILIDEKGNIFGETGNVSADENWITVMTKNTYYNPVVIAGVPQQLEEDPGIVRVQNVTANSFDIQFQEWNYEDGNHAQEYISYLVVEGSIPLDASILCNSDSDSLEIGKDIIAIDNCDINIALQYEETTMIDGNTEQIIRTWYSIDECGNATGYSQIVPCTGVAIQLKVMLQGAMLDSDTEDLMRDDLRQQGLLPTKEPYTAMPSFKHVGTGGGEECLPELFNIVGKKAIVDWVFVELRNQENQEEVVATCSGLVQRNGQVIAANGDSLLYFNNLPPSNYYVAIRHRNHVQAETMHPYLCSGNIIPMVDFTYDFLPTIGNSPFVIMENTKAMWSGDLNNSTSVIYQGPQNDVFRIFLEVLLDSLNQNYLTNFINSGYTVNDFNLDGRTIYQGPNNDRSKLLFETILKHPDNKNYLPNFIISTNERIDNVNFDNCQSNPTLAYCDFDNDGKLNNSDPDDDNDGVIDGNDEAPYNVYSDSDKDGKTDQYELLHDMNPLNACDPFQDHTTCIGIDIDQDGLYGNYPFGHTLYDENDQNACIPNQQNSYCSCPDINEDGYLLICHTNALGIKQTLRITFAQWRLRNALGDTCGACLTD